jgi:hypothetical protein
MGGVVSEARLTAARALARGIVHPGEEPLLATLDPSLWQVVPTSAGPVLTLVGHLHLHAADLAGLPVARLSPTQAKTLLAVLIATRTGAAHPYPGVTATVDDVLTVLGGHGMGVQAAAHAKGALNKLHAWRLARLGRPDAEEEELVTADLAVPVRVGPAVALWSGPWVGELVTLVGHLAEHRRPR